MTTEAWSLKLFGALTLESPAGELVTLPTRKAGLLLAYLSLRLDETVSRDQVATALWPDADRDEARNRLNVTLFRLRETIESGGNEFFIEVNRASLRLSSQRIVSDVYELRRGILRAPKLTNRLLRGTVISNALEHVTGPFLNEFDEPWVVYQRTTLEREILSAISVVALNFVERGDQRVDIKSALSAAETLPVREELLNALHEFQMHDRIMDARGFADTSNLLLDPPVPLLIDHRTEWNAAADFDDTNNPNGAWCYGWTWEEGLPFQPYRCRGQVASLQGTIPRLRSSNWRDPSALVHRLDEPFMYHQFMIPPHTLLLHPGQLGQKSVARWTCPNHGRFRVRVRFFRISPHATTDVSISVAGEVAFTGRIAPDAPDVPHAFTVELQKGEVLDATVGTGGDGYFHDSTGLDFSIIPC